MKTHLLGENQSTRCGTHSTATTVADMSAVTCGACLRIIRHWARASEREKEDVVERKIDDMVRVAAPELLTALQAIQAWLDAALPLPADDRALWDPLFVKAHDLMCAAIAKAEGR